MTFFRFFVGDFLEKTSLLLSGFLLFGEFAGNAWAALRAANDTGLFS